MTTEFFVVNLQLGPASADLASPIIAPEYLSAELLILDGFQLQPRAFRANGAFTHFDSARQERIASDGLAGI